LGLLTEGAIDVAPSFYPVSLAPFRRNSIRLPVEKYFPIAGLILFDFREVIWSRVGF